MELPGDSITSNTGARVESIGESFLLQLLLGAGFAGAFQSFVMA